MLPELIIDDKRVREELGFSLKENNMQNLIFLDHPDELVPVLIKRPDGSKALIVRNIEAGNYQEGGRNCELVKKANASICLYDSYFLMETIRACEFPVFKTEGLALRDGFEIAKAAVSDVMPYERYKRFCTAVEIELIPTEKKDEKYYAYEIDQNYVADRFTRVEPEEVELAVKLLKERTHRNAEEIKILEGYMNAERVNPFDLLSNMMKQDHVEQIMVDSISSVHLLSAIPWDELRPDQMFVYYDGEKAILLCTEEQNRSFLNPVRGHVGFQSMAATLSGGKKLGVETKNMPVGRVLEIGEENVFDISTLFGLWRTRQTCQFLALYIINANADMWAIEKVVEHVEAKVAAGHEVTERDACLLHQQLLNHFGKEHGFESMHLTITQYSDVFHAGSRTIRPSMASDYKLQASCKTMKVDVGSALYRDGILMCGCDLARTCCFTEEAKKAYKILGDCLHNGCIGTIRAGMTGREIYWLGVEGLIARESELKALHVMPADFSLRESYQRDIGHCIDKQVTYYVSIDRENTNKFENYMAGNLEFQWPYRDYGLCVEETYFVAPEGTFDLVY